MIRLALRRPVATVVVFLAIVFTGVVAYRQLSLSLFPSFDLPELTVVCEYPGATPMEVEEYITRPLEQAVSGVTGVRLVQGISRENLAVLRLQFDWGSNMEYATLNVREKLDAARMARGFPQDASRPTILKWNPATTPVMGIFVSAQTDIPDLTEFLDTAIKQRIEGIDGVSAIQLKGGLEKEVIITFDSRKMAFYGLTPRQVGWAVQDHNQDQAGGMIRQEGYRYALRVLASVKTLEEIRAIPVKRAGLNPVLLQDVARVEWGSPDPTVMARMDGRRGVVALVYKTVGANTLDTIEAVQTALVELREDYPAIHFHVAFENGKMIRVAIANVVQAIILGGILAFLIILFFLGNFRAPLVISISIPVSIVATFALMMFLDVNLNIMSLSGLALGVGMLVDNAIVVLESIVQRKQAGDADAAYSGTRQVAGAVLASTLTTMSVFLPLLLVHGIAGHIFRDQSLTICFSLFCSYLVSITLLPVVSRSLFDTGGTGTSVPRMVFPRPGWKRGFLLFPWYLLVYVGLAVLFLVYRLTWLIGRLIRFFLGLIGFLLTPPIRWFDRAYQWIFHLYHNLLAVLLDRKALLSGMGMLILVGGIFSGTLLRREFFPKTRADQVRFTIALPGNASLPASESVAHQLENFLQKIPGVENVLVLVGVDPADLTAVTEDAGANYLNVTLRISGGEELIRNRVEDWCKTRDALTLTFKKAENEFAMLFRTGTMRIKFLSERRSDAISCAGQAAVWLREQPEVVTVSDNYSASAGKGLQVKFKDDVLMRYGIQGRDLGDFISTALRGDVVSVLKLTDRNYNIRLRLERGLRETVEQLEQTVFLHDGQPLKLRELIDIQPVTIPQRLERESQSPMAVLTIETKSGTDTAGFMERAISYIEKLPENRGVLVREGEEMREMRRSLRSLQWALLLSFALVYLLLAAQFESFKIPFVIIFTFPMGLAGAFLLLLATGQTLNVISAVGIVILGGIVVNDAIVKVDCIHQKVTEGKGIRDAVLAGSAERFRPIWMTTLTTILGVTPVFFLPGAGSDLLKPLAVVLTGGMLMATTLTLFLIPAIYEVVAKGRRVTPKAEIRP